VAVDLRLIGSILRDRPATVVSKALLPYTWIGFGLMLATGLPLFAAESIKLYGNPAFRLKLLLLVIAGCNALLFHKTVGSGVTRWVRSEPGPRVKAFAGASLLLWFAIIVLGRLIAVFRVH
jgi:hypothetical protein